LPAKEEKQHEHEASFAVAAVWVELPAAGAPDVLPD
jgi:hypothetical protein